MKFYSCILICGDRNWTDFDLVSDVIAGLQPTLVIQGGAKGADTCAREAAQVHKIPYLEFRPKWEDHGKAAGPIRNQQMLTEGKPDLVIAFHNDLPSSKGTKDMVTRARKARLPVKHYFHTPTGWGSKLIL